jgi:hypothetical protein
MDRNQFFAELDQLTQSQIEARLASWDSEQLKLVEEYLGRGTIKPQAESVAVAMATSQ